MNEIQRKIKTDQYSKENGPNIYEVLVQNDSGNSQWEHNVLIIFVQENSSYCDI